MLFVKTGETTQQAAKRQCAERGHDFYRSHRCWNCNIPFNEVDKPKESFDNDYRFIEGRHVQ